MGGAWSWAAGFLLLLAVNGKQKMAREKFGKEGKFSVSSSLEKSILSHPRLTAQGGGFPNTAQEGLVGGEGAAAGERGGKKRRQEERGAQRGLAPVAVPRS